MKPSLKILQLAKDVENYCELNEYCFETHFAQAFAELRHTLEDVEYLAAEWGTIQPDPYHDATSDLPLSVRLTRKHGIELRTKLLSIDSDTKRTQQ